MPLADALKGVGSQFIVLHHLAFYGPMSDAAAPLAPAFFGWLYEYGRMAVQVFLVIGGFMAAKTLSPDGTPVIRNPLATVSRRYMRLALPYAAALTIAVAVSAAARTLMDHESISAPPTFGQVVAHLLLLHDILGYEALSAGVWYVAIDFQLFALMTAMLWAAHRSGFAHLAPMAIAALGIASLFYFNLDPAWDAWAPYFAGAYAMGALAYWASAPDRSPAWLWLLGAVVATALLADFRERIAVALATALLLALSRRSRLPDGRSRGRILAFLGDISYSVFLIHFPVCLIVNAGFYRLFGNHPEANAAGIAIAWAVSIVAGTLFHRWIEAQVHRIRGMKCYDRHGRNGLRETDHGRQD